MESAIFVPLVSFKLMWLLQSHSFQISLHWDSYAFISLPLAYPKVTSFWPLQLVENNYKSAWLKSRNLLTKLFSQSLKCIIYYASLHPLPLKNMLKVVYPLGSLNLCWFLSVYRASFCILKGWAVSQCLKIVVNQFYHTALLACWRLKSIPNLT